jgi:hypothetical protein
VESKLSGARDETIHKRRIGGIVYRHASDQCVLTSACAVHVLAAGRRSLVCNDGNLGVGVIRGCASESSSGCRKHSLG